MASINKAIIVGRLGRDPETRYAPSGDAITSASIATDEVWKDKNGGKQERTEWHRVVFFGRLAEIAGEYLKKGSLVYVEGRLQTRKWQDQGGQDRYTTEIVAAEMKMLDSRSSPGSATAAGSPPDDGFSTMPEGGLTSTARPNPAGTAAKKNDFSGLDDDIPF